MAKDGDRYKEGVDFEWVNSNAKTKDGGFVKTRRFFSRAEKAERANPKKEAPKAAPAKSSGGGSSAPAKASGPKKPRANPARQPGGARPTVGAAGGMPAAKGGKGGDVNPLAVGVMGAGALAAGVAAARSGRGPAPTGARGENSAKVQRSLPKPPARLALPAPAKALPKPEGAKGENSSRAQRALPAPNKGGTIIPENKKPKALPKPEGAKGENKSNVQKAIAKSRSKPKAKPAKPKGPGGSRSGVRGGIGIDITTNPLEQIKDPLQLMNKGGMVKKKK